MLAPEKRKMTSNKVPKKGVPWGGESKLTSPRYGVTAKRRSELEESKYGPGSGPQCNAGGSRYPSMYNTLMQEPSRTRRTKLLKDNSRAELAYDRNMRRPVRARIRNQ